MERDRCPLSRSELEVLRLSALGYTEAQVASLLQKSVQTVKNQLTAARTKLGASNKAHLVYIATVRGWLNKEAPLMYLHCTVCNEPIGQKGSTPAVKVGDQYVHQGKCQYRLAIQQRRTA